MKNSKSSTLFVECANVAEMHKLSNTSNNRFSLGGGKAEIAISGVMHYFVIKDESYRTRTMKWLREHAKTTIKDLRTDDLDVQFSPSQMCAFMQKVLRDAIENGNIHVEYQHEYLSLFAVRTDSSLCA